MSQQLKHRAALLIPSPGSTGPGFSVAFALCSQVEQEGIQLGRNLHQQELSVPYNQEVRNGKSLGVIEGRLEPEVCW